MEGDSASVSIATAAISAIENIPIDQTVAMTGSLSVRGAVLPVGGVTAKVEAAIEAGMKRVIVPAANFGDIVLDQAHEDKIEIISASDIREVWDNALIASPEKQKFLSSVADFLNSKMFGGGKQGTRPGTNVA